MTGEGIDYTHPAFINEDGSSRILSIWDQTIQGTQKHPESFDYGREFTREEINAALLAENPWEVVASRDTRGHGTFMAGVACGNANPSQEFAGVAPEATICVVKCKTAKNNLKQYYQIADSVECYSEGDIMLGVRYLWQVAAQRRMPLVLCIGMGTNMGGHQGGGALGELLQYYGNFRGNFMVGAAGNEGNLARHYQSQGIDAGAVEEVEFRVDQGKEGFTMELWSVAPELYSVGLVSPSGEYSGRTLARQGESRRIPFLLEDTVVEIEYLIVARENGDECIRFRFQTPAEGIWRLRVFSENNFTGNFHVWLPMKELLSANTYFLRADPDTTICDPCNNAGIITIAYYNPETEGISEDSSRGYTREGMIKPDIAAPGVRILGPLPFLGTVTASTQEERQRAARYGYVTGSSVGAALASGVVALLVEWGSVRGNDISMDTVSVRKYLIRGATPQGLSVPNRVWGNGKLNLFGVFDALRPK